ncbi:MAG: hypothetical protein J6I41_03215 [Bacteroidales bacterium]|nr:hypothetical protein [Bacteroidales bacterium]
MIDKEIIIRRLAVIKYLYNTGVQQSMQVETVAGFSVLTFHDCAEMFLILVAENKNDKCEKWSFMDFWNNYPELTLRESMRNLKERRISIKHKGQFPSKADIEISRITMADFLEQNCITQFGIEFRNISVTSLIKYEDVRKYVDIAEKAYENGQLYDSLVNSKIAFVELLAIYDISIKDEFQTNDILSIGEKVGNDYEKLVSREKKSGTIWYKQVTETINKIRDVLKVTAVGIDYRKYTFFDTVTPFVYSCWKDDVWEYESRPKSYYEERPISNENCRFCIDFVIDCALKLQEFDYDANRIKGYF